MSSSLRILHKTDVSQEIQEAIQICNKTNDPLPLTNAQSKNLQVVKPRNSVNPADGIPNEEEEPTSSTSQDPAISTNQASENILQEGKKNQIRYFFSRKRIFS
jgi:hypothetical protein